MSDRNGVPKAQLRRVDYEGRWWRWRFYGDNPTEGGWELEDPPPDGPSLEHPTPPVPRHFPWFGPGHCEACVGLRDEVDELRAELDELRWLVWLIRRLRRGAA